MIELNPKQVFFLAKHAYDLQNGASSATLEVIRMAVPSIDIESVKLLTTSTGLLTPVASGFGFMARLNGGRSREIVIATRGSSTGADWGSNVQINTVQGPTGHMVHKGFATAFKSHVQQLNQYISLQNLGFKPTAIHCVGHSLGGALANLNAAACAELRHNAYLYTVAAPRVGHVPYAEHLSNKLNAAHVYRIANEADPVTMLPSFPFVHAPYVHGTLLLDGGWLKINADMHKLGKGYSALTSSTWSQLQSLTHGRQQQLQNSMYAANRPQAGYFEQLVKLPGAMFSGRLLKLINQAIHDMLARMGAQSLLSVSHYGSGSFTVMDQLSEILTRYAQASQRKAQEVTGMLNAVMAYLGRSTYAIADASVSTIRWVFGLLQQSLNAMAGQAIQLVGR